MRSSRAWATILVLAAMMFFVRTAYADDSPMRLGIGGIRAGNHIYYGDLNAAYDGTKYSGSESSIFYWRVLDSTKDNTGQPGACFLMSENLVGDKNSKGKQHTVKYCTKKDKHHLILYKEYNTWHDTDMPDWCQRFCNNVFSPLERSALRPITKSEGSYFLAKFDILWQIYDPNSGHADPQWMSVGIYSAPDTIRDQRVFFASYDEVKAYVGLGTAALAKMNGKTQWWWMRTPVDNTGHGDGFTPSLEGVNGTVYATAHNNRTDKKEGVNYAPVSYSYYVRPVTNLDTSKVLFSNVIDAKAFAGPVGEDGLTKVVDFHNLNDWELTIEDPDQRAFDAQIVFPQEDPHKLTLSVSNVPTGANRYISAIITSGSSNTITHYGRLADCSTSAPSTVKVNLPTDFDNNHDRLYVFSEEYRGGTKTSYASPLDWIDTVDRYTVTFDLNGRGAPQPATQYVKDNERATKPEDNITAPGYGFDRDESGATRWYTGPGWGGEVYNFNHIVHEPWTLYARWNPLPYTVAFDSNGGDGQMDEQQRVYDDGVALPKATFTHGDGNFTGWNTKADGTGDRFADQTTLNVMTPAEKDGQNQRVTLYAQWTDEFVVTFDTCGHGLAPTPASATVATEWKITEPTAPVAEGYTFGGWYKDPDCPDESAWNFASDVVPCDLTLYAKWVGKPYVVRFDPGKGSGSMDDQARVVGDEVSLPACTFAAPVTDSGALFTGWNTAADGSGDAFSDQSTLDVAFDGEVTLYAQWSPSFIAVFDLNGRGAPRPAPQMRGVQHEWLAKEPEPTPTAVGYTCGGWYKEPGCENVWDFASEPLSQSLTYLYAEWVPNDYWIAFDSNGGQGQMDTAYRHYDDERALPINTYTNPTAGDESNANVFCGWNTEPDGSGDAFCDEDTQNVTDQLGVTVTLYAQWYNAQITTNRLADGMLDEPYEAELAQVGLILEPDAPVWSLVDGDLPAGLALAADGRITGTPTQAGTYTFRVRVEGKGTYNSADALPVVLQKELTLFIGQEEPDLEIYRFTEGMNGIWTNGSGEDLQFKTNGYFPLFDGLQVDGVALVENTDFRAASGSTELTLIPEYLGELSVGSHIITALYADGQEPFTQFTVATAPEPAPEPSPEPVPSPEPTPEPTPKPGSNPQTTPKSSATPSSTSSPESSSSSESQSARAPLPNTSDPTFWF